MATRAIRFALLLLAMIAVFSGIAAAQETITYGQSVTGKIDQQTPQTFYTFNGNAGELVTAYVIGTSENLQPTLALFGPTGQLAFSSGNPYTPINTDAGVTYRLPAPGLYSLFVGGAPNTVGSFMLALNNITPAASTPIAPEVPAQANVVAGMPPQHFSFAASPDAPLQLTLRTETPGFSFAATIYGADGQVMAVIGKGTSAVLAVPSAQGNYAVQVAASDPAGQGIVTILVSGSVGQPSGGQAPPPQTTQEASAPPANVCSATPASGAVNVRGGPGTDYNVIGTLQVGSYLTVTGQNSGWYNGTLGGQSGWVAGSVITLNGPCSSLPTVQAPPPPQQPQQTQPTLGPTQTQIGTGAGQPTLPPPPPTPTPASQTAPPDNEPHNFAINRDTGGQFSQVVSYPDGDTQDRIATSINLDQVNSERTVVFVLNCSGPGGENVRLTRGSPNAQQYACGQPLTWRYAAPYSTEDFYVIVAGGSGVYVNYTLTATIQP